MKRLAKGLGCYCGFAPVFGAKALQANGAKRRECRLLRHYEFGRARKPENLMGIYPYLNV